MTISPELLKQIAPGNRNQQLLLDLSYWMNIEFPLHGIDTLQEIRHFLAQCAHESDSFNTLEEYASGKAYEGRKDLGNIHPGDGVKFKGKGLIETTGYDNYYALGIKLGEPNKFIDRPELLKDPQWGVWSACEFWNDRHLYDIANMLDNETIWTKKYGNISPLKYITYRINGGQNGLDSRTKFYQRAKKFIT